MPQNNPQRDASNALFQQLGYTVLNNWSASKHTFRHIALEMKALKFQSTKERNAWKLLRVAELKELGLFLFDDDKGAIKNGVFSIYGQLEVDKIPGYVAPTPVTKTAKQHELPQSVSDYIVNDLGRKLQEVIAHRHVNGEEPKYAVLMRDNAGYMWTVVFYGKYVARRPLGPYEEAYDANAQLIGWECLYDSGEWNDSVERFKNAPASFF
jgi:hypothetical protein